MMNNIITIIYITGKGHSGSTLLDIIIGSYPAIFSTGELSLITRNSIIKEYCSCAELIKDNGVWSKIVAIWPNNSPVSLEEYKKLQLKFKCNKTIVRALVSILSSSQDFKTYCEATRLLFEAIQKVTGKSVIVDSSKSPQRIPVLNKIVNLKVLHLCRNAKGVLNSAKSSIKKDIKAGTETDFPARKTSKTLFEWVFTIGVDSKRIKYKDYIENLKSLETFHPEIKIPSDQVFSPTHMLTGNILRLKKNIKVDRNLGSMYKRLSKKQLKIASTIDFIFPYWS